MDGNVLIIVEAAVIFGLVIGFGVWELRKLRKLREHREREAASRDAARKDLD